MEHATMDDWRTVCDGLDPEESLREKHKKIFVPDLICLKFLKELATSMISQFPTTQAVFYINRFLSEQKTNKQTNK